jgi:death-on-curing protein
MKTPDGFVHLSVDQVRAIHQRVLREFGGSDGVRELGLLESAALAPQATFGGQSVYADLPEVAAAYLVGLCKNHPFVDGNKRTALAACLAFLKLNGATPSPDQPAWEQLTLDVASGKINRDKTVVRLRKFVN